MIKTTAVSLLFFLFTYATAFSQSVWTLSYEPATPLGDMTDFTGKTSFRGLGASANWYVTDRITVGATVQWTGFYEKNERGTWYFDGGALTATAWKEFYILPLYVNAKYHFVEEGKLIPYAGLSLGTAYVEQSVQVGKYDFEEKSWRFSLAPEAGVRIPMGLEQSWGFNIMLRYQMQFYNENVVDLIQYLNYSLGVYWKITPDRY